jgi:hypothetical protein
MGACVPHPGEKNGPVLAQRVHFPWLQRNRAARSARTRAVGEAHPHIRLKAAESGKKVETMVRHMQGQGTLIFTLFFPHSFR